MNLQSVVVDDVGRRRQFKCQSLPPLSLLQSESGFPLPSLIVTVLGVNNILLPQWDTRPERNSIYLAYLSEEIKE